MGSGTYLDERKKLTDSRYGKVLVTQGSLFEIAGSEVVTLELVQHFASRADEVVVVTYGFGTEWALVLGDIQGVSLFRYDDPALDQNLGQRAPDLAWIHHQLIPESVLRAPRTTKFVFHHMSAYHPAEFPVSYGIEEALASAVVFAAPETMAAHLASSLLDHVIPTRLSVLGNPAPAQFDFSREHRSVPLRRLLVVSNHIPGEMREALSALPPGVTVTIRGNEADNGGESKVVTPSDIADSDAVVTIGKTVQYALLSGTPVYCYDHFGGPGWLTPENFEVARFANFSGRGFERKDSRSISRELVGDYGTAVTDAETLKSEHRDEFILDSVVGNVLNHLPSRPALQPREQDVAAHLLAQDLRRIYVNVIAARQGEVVQLSQRLVSAEREVERLSSNLASIASSRSYRLAQRIAAAARRFSPIK